MSKKNTPSFFTLHKNAHYMQPGAVAFIPGWIMLFITILSLAILFPNFFPGEANQNLIINKFLFAFIIGSLLPAFDDLLAFLFGPPFAHHSLFHSIPGVLIAYMLFFIFFGANLAKYAALGNLYHIFFNYYLDFVTLFFPFSYREFGLTDIIRVSTYWLKVIHYPIILILFVFSIVFFLK